MNALNEELPTENLDLMRRVLNGGSNWMRNGSNHLYNMIIAPCAEKQISAVAGWCLALEWSANQFLAVNTANQFVEMILNTNQSREKQIDGFEIPTQKTVLYGSSSFLGFSFVRYRYVDIKNKRKDDESWYEQQMRMKLLCGLNVGWEHQRKISLRSYGNIQEYHYGLSLVGGIIYSGPRMDGRYIDTKRMWSRHT